LDLINQIHKEEHHLNGDAEYLGTPR